MRVAFVHYHVKAGGVTRVMENALLGLGKTGSDFEVVVLSGHEPPENCVLPVKVVDGLGYVDAASGVDPVLLANRMEEAVKSQLGGLPDVWHIHNTTLGKNPSTADAVAELAKRGYHLVLQIHDFAEDGRPANYRLRQGTLQSPSAYPTGDRIHYVVLNRRDYKVLKLAGISENHLHWLPNPVAIPEFDDDPVVNTTTGPEELVVYPVRAVRRKNFGELLLHAALGHKRRSYVTTLGTTSGDFVDEYQQWQEFSRELGLMVDFGVCERFEFSFPTLIDRAHCIITTSVAEGFGLGFLEPWMFGKTLVGRDLPEISEDFKSFGVQLDQLYSGIDIPIDTFRFDEFRSRLARMMEQFQASYGLVYDASGADLWVEHAVSDFKIDFAKLDEIAQREIIEKVQASPDLQKSVGSQVNFEIEPAEHVDANATIIQNELSIPKYGDRLQHIYEANLSDGSDSQQIEFADSDMILEAFIGYERFLPLRS